MPNRGDRKVWVNGELIDKEWLTDIQLGPRFDADTVTYPRLPDGSENPSWALNQRDPIKPSELDASFLGGAPVGGVVTFDDAATPTLGFVPVEVSSGCMLNSQGEHRCWPTSNFTIEADATVVIWADGDSLLMDAQILNNNNNSLPPRTTPHIPLARVVTGADDITSITDLRPITHVGTTHDYPLALQNTDVLNSTSPVVVAAQGEYPAVSLSRILCDATLGTFAIVLPESPVDGEVIGIADVASSFGTNPVILRPYYTLNGAGDRINAYFINGEEDDWIFDVDGTYVELFWSEEKNSWYFLELPDTDCALKLGTFVGCGTAIPTIDQEVNCIAPNTWDPVKLRCFRPITTASYSDGAGDTFERELADRCQAVPPAGQFFRCDGTTAEFHDGSGGINVVEGSFVCGAPSKSGIPIGMMMPYAAGGGSLPILESTGWLVCDGQSVLINDYPELFALIGHTYSSGDDVVPALNAAEQLTTFRVPQLGNRYPSGQGTPGVPGGNTNITLSTGQLPSHDHVVDDPGHTHTGGTAPHSHSVNDPGHAHAYNFAIAEINAGQLPWPASNDDARIIQQGTTVSGTNISIASSAPTVNLNSATTGISTQSVGSGDDINIQDRFMGVGAWVIKATDA